MTVRARAAPLQVDEPLDKQRSDKPAPNNTHAISWYRVPESYSCNASALKTANLRTKILDFRGFDSSII